MPVVLVPTAYRGPTNGEAEIAVEVLLFGTVAPGRLVGRVVRPSKLPPDDVVADAPRLADYEERRKEPVGPRCRLDKILDLARLTKQWQFILIVEVAEGCRLAVLSWLSRHLVVSLKLIDLQQKD